MKRFEDLDVWNDAKEFAVNIYKTFSNLKDFGMRDQIQRASVSIPSNISESYERGSTSEFIRFLFIAKGSAGEVRTQLYICKDLGYVNQN